VYSNGPTPTSNQNIGTGHYLLQAEWSNEDGGCALQDEVDSVNAALPSSAVAGVPIHFTGSGTDGDGRIAIAAWGFGDGSSASGLAVTHAFTRAGRFTVTFAIQDIAGQRAHISRSILVSVARITHISATTSKFTGKVNVGTNGPGTVRLGGAHKSLSRAGTARFKITLRGKNRRKLAKRGTQHVTVSLKVAFTPVGGSKQTRTVSLTFRG
jgi:hypothetical protein